MDKEREAFDKWYGIKPKGRFEAVRYDTAWRAWQAAKDDSHKQAALYQSEINHLAQANQQWHEKAAKAQAVPEWVSVEDRLPKRQENVLVASKHDFVCIASLTNNHRNNKFYDGDGLAINSITHWMPMIKCPKPPLQAQESDND